MLRFKRAVDGDAEIIGLFLGKLRQFDADFFQVQAGDFFVEFFRQNVNANFVIFPVFPKVELCQNLIRK